MTHEMPGYVRGSDRVHGDPRRDWDAIGGYLHGASSALDSASASERMHDLQTSVEATIPQTATRVYAKYRINTAFWSAEPDASMGPARTRGSTCA